MKSENRTYSAGENQNYERTGEMQYMQGEVKENISFPFTQST